MNSILKKILFLIVICFLAGFINLIIPANPVYSATCSTCRSSNIVTEAQLLVWNATCDSDCNNTALKAACKVLCPASVSGKLDNPLGSNNLGPVELYGRLIYSFMGITGAIALIMFLVGGFQWMTAAGNPEKVKKGRDTLMWAVLGLIVIFSSYAILKVVFETLQF